MSQLVRNEAGPSTAPEGSNDDQSTGVKRKARAARACTACNKQKLKCNGEAPCARCLSLDIAGACTYIPSMRGKTRRKRSEITTQTNLASPTLSDTGPAMRLQSEPNDGRHQPQINWRPADVPPRHSPTSPGGGRLHVPNNVRPSSMPGRDIYPMPRRQSSKQDSPHLHTSAISDKLTTLPLPGDGHNPLAVLAEASMGLEHDATSPGLKRDVGEEHQEESYYAPLERTLKDEAPHIMRFLSFADVQGLFDIYFKHLHRSCSRGDFGYADRSAHLPLLDREHSSPVEVASRNNFLFNAICCVSARSYNIGLWERLKGFAKSEMERLPLEKNIDVVQGHLIYAEWNLIRPKRFEQDMTWLRVGIASRTAIDINLHRVALVKDARDNLPPWLLKTIIRTWLLCFVVDRTTSAQLGKPSSMRGENSIRQYLQLARETETDPTTDGLSRLDNLSVACWAEWTQILARSMDVFRNDASYLPSLGSGGNHNSYPDLVHVFDKQFKEWRTASQVSVDLSGASGRGVQLVKGRIRLYHHYSQLVVFSFGLQRAVDCNPIDLPAAFAGYQTAAIRLIESFETGLDNPRLTRGCPDFAFTVLTYAIVSLLKATQAQFVHLEPNHDQIFAVARAATNMLAQAAVTTDHLPAVQASFLNKLLDIRTNEHYQPAAFVPDPIDFQAFADSLMTDRSKSLWPPSRPRTPEPAQTSRSLDAAGTSSDFLSNSAEQSARYPSANSAPATANFDMAAVMSSIGVTPPGIPGAALGLSVGSFLTDQELLFSTDNFWKSILEGATETGT